MTWCWPQEAGLTTAWDNCRTKIFMIFWSWKWYWCPWRQNYEFSSLEALNIWNCYSPGIYIHTSKNCSSLLSSELFFRNIFKICYNDKNWYSIFHLKTYLPTRTYRRDIEWHFYKQKNKFAWSQIKKVLAYYWISWISLWMLCSLTAVYFSLYVSLSENSFIRCCNSLQIILTQTIYYLCQNICMGTEQSSLKQSVLSIQKWLILRGIYVATEFPQSKTEKSFNNCFSFA